MEEPRIVSKGAFTLIGLEYRGKNDNQEIPQLWGKLLPRFGEFEKLIKSHESYGAARNVDKDSGDFDYLAGYEFAGGEDLPAGMKIWDVPEQKYAVFTATLPTLKKTFKSISENWLPESGYEQTSGTEFEYYDETFDPQDSNSIVFLYIPIA